MKISPHLLASIAAATLLLTAVSGAQAQNTPAKNALGLNSSYVELGAGRSDYSLGNGIGAFTADQGDTAYGLRTGSYFNPNFGFEMGLTDFGRVNRAGGSTSAMGLNFSVLGKYPLSDSVNLLGKIGTTYGRTKVSSAPASGVPQGEQSGFGLSYGVGAEYLMTPQWSAVLQYESHDLPFAGDRHDRVGDTTLSARYRF